jgi:hypothetical protein
MRVTHFIGFVNNLTSIKTRALACWLTASTGWGAFSGCATVTRGANERFTVITSPSDAVVRLSTGQTGFSPTTFTIPRKGDLVVVVTKEGFDRKEVVVKAEVSGGGTAGFLGNVVIGGIIGGAMDIGTGAALSHSPNPLAVTLIRTTPEEESSRGQSGSPDAADSAK